MSGVRARLATGRRGVKPKTETHDVTVLVCANYLRRGSAPLMEGQ